MQWQHCELHNQLKTSPVLWGKPALLRNLPWRCRERKESCYVWMWGWGWGNEHQDNWEKKENEKKPRSWFLISQLTWCLQKCPSVHIGKLAGIVYGCLLARSSAVLPSLWIGVWAGPSVRCFLKLVFCNTSDSHLVRSLPLLLLAVSSNFVPEHSP